MSKISMVGGALGGYLLTLLGGFDSRLEALIIIMIVDMIIGVVMACFGKSDKTQSGYLSSTEMRKGIFKKTLCLVVVLVAVLIERFTGTDFLRDLVVISLFAVEAVSVLEHCGNMGIRIPSIIFKALDILQKKGNTQENNENLKKTIE